MAGFFLPRPDPPLLDEDPFRPDAASTPFEQYGVAGLSWHVYEPDCGGVVPGQSSGASVWAANVLFLPAKVLVAGLAGVTQAALAPSYLDVLDRVVADIAGALEGGGNPLVAALTPLMVLLTGLLVMGRATRARASESTAVVAWALLMVAVLAVVVRWPQEVGRSVDRVLTSVAGVAAEAMGVEDSNTAAGRNTDVARPGVRVADRLYGPFLYRAWLEGEFCDADSPAARKYGPEILRTQALSWSEADRIRQGQVPAEEVVSGHQARFDAVAQKVREEDRQRHNGDEQSYRCVAGRGSSAVSAALTSDLAALVVAPFLLVSGLLLIAAYLIMRLAVMLAPLLLLAGLFHPLRGIVHAASRMVAAALINAVLFTFLMLLVVRVDGVILTSRIPSGLRIILLGIVTALMWYLGQPVGRLTTMITPASYRRHLENLGRVATRRTAQRSAWFGHTLLDPHADVPALGPSWMLRQEAQGPVALPFLKAIPAPVLAAGAGEGGAAGLAAGAAEGGGAGLAAAAGGKGTSARVFNSADAHVADAANSIEAALPGRVISVNTQRAMANGLTREVDIDLGNILVQVKSGNARGLTGQIMRTQASTGTRTIGYAPDMSDAAWSNAAREGIPILRTPGELIAYIREFG